MPRLTVSSSSMISMARTLGAPERVPAGRAAISTSTGSSALGRVALDVGDDVHDVAVALDDEAVGDPHVGPAGALRRGVAARLPQHGHAADVVAAQVQQHQVLGPLLRIGQQFRLQSLILGRRLAARAGAGDGADGDLAVPQANQDFGAGADQLEVAEVQKEHEGRGVEPPAASGRGRTDRA